MNYYKVARPDGWDFYTGRTINYRDAIGKTASIEDVGKYGLCSGSVIHASANPLDALKYGKIPCSAYLVRGKPVVVDDDKCGFTELKVMREYENLDRLFGFKYSEVVNPIHPFRIKPPKITKRHIELVHVWASVWDSVGASVWDSVQDSVWASVGAYVWASVGDPVGCYIEGFVGASVGAYVSSLFPGIKTWEYIDHPEGKNPFMPAIRLWRMGLVPSFDGKIWRLHGGGKVLWEGKFN